MTTEYLYACGSDERGNDEAAASSLTVCTFLRPVYIQCVGLFITILFFFSFSIRDSRLVSNSKVRVTKKFVLSTPNEEVNKSRRVDDQNRTSRGE